MIEDIEAYRPQTTVVFFGGNRTHWWTRFLKKGYYHCFIAMDIGCRKWVLIDPVMNYTDSHSTIMIYHFHQQGKMVKDEER